MLRTMKMVNPRRRIVLAMSRARQDELLEKCRDVRAEYSGPSSRQGAPRMRTMEKPQTGPSEQLMQPPAPVQLSEDDLLSAVTGLAGPDTARAAPRVVTCVHASGSFSLILGKLPGTTARATARGSEPVRAELVRAETVTSSRGVTT